RPAMNRAEHTTQILFFKEAVCTGIALRLTVSPLVVGDDVEPSCAEPLDDPSAPPTIVANAVKVDDGPASPLSRVTSPTLQLQTFAVKRRVFTRRRDWPHVCAARWVQQRVCTVGGKLTPNKCQRTYENDTHARQNEPPSR